VSSDDDMVGEQRPWLQLRFRPVTHHELLRGAGPCQEWGVRKELTVARWQGPLEAEAESGATGESATLRNPTVSASGPQYGRVLLVSLVLKRPAGF
jgi:hypothetical protein